MSLRSQIVPAQRHSGAQLGKVHAALGLLAALLLLAAPSHAQRPILPICSDDPSYKLPPCHAATPSPTSPDQPAAPAPATQFPFPGTDAPAAPANSTPPPSATQTATPAPADRFPFPGERPSSAAPAQPGASAPAAPTPKTPAASQFPFPGESVPLPVIDPKEKVYDPNDPDDTKGRRSAQPPGLPTSPSQPPPTDSSSSSSSSSPDSVPALKDEGSEGSTRASRRLLPKVEDLTAREEEDIKVAKFYHSSGNYLAAYNRAKDALKIDPKDPEAQLALAVNAQKLSKRDEAIAAYTAYLKLAPDGDDVKLAQHELASLK